MKTCTKCKIEQSKDCFQKDKSRHDSLQPWCKNCISISNKKDYRQNKEARSTTKKAYGKKNRSQINAYEREYYANNPGKSAAKDAKYKAAKLNATPPWLTEERIKEIEEFYANCPNGYEVDHIVPLQGKTVRGLHVPWNLQYLTVSDNRTKNNRIEL